MGSGHIVNYIKLTSSGGGTFTANLNLNANLELFGGVSEMYNGKIIIPSGNTLVVDAFTSLKWYGGDFTPAGGTSTGEIDVISSGFMLWQSANAMGNDIDNHGLIQLNNTSTITLKDVTVYNEASGEINVTADNTNGLDDTVPKDITNEGVIRKTSGTGTYAFADSVYNDGSSGGTG